MADGFCQRIAPQLMAELPCLRLVDPHEWRVKHKTLLHTQIQGHLKGLDGVIPAVRITGIVRFTHAGDDMADAAAEGESGGKGQEDQVPARHEGVGQAVFSHADFRIPCQCRVGEGAEAGEVNRVVFAQFCGPMGILGADALPEGGAAVQLHGVALPIGKADCLDMIEMMQRPCQTGGGILPPGEQNERTAILGGLMAGGRC